MRHRLSPSGARRPLAGLACALACLAPAPPARAQAVAQASCRPAPASPAFLCRLDNGTSDSSEERFGADNLVVTTGAPLVIDTSATRFGSPLVLFGNGLIQFIDPASSGTVLRSDPDGGGLFVGSYGPAGGVPGGIAIDTAASITGGYAGIYADNYGLGDITISAVGDVSGRGPSFGLGIRAVNDDASSGGVTVAAGNVAGDATGINAYTRGLGPVSVSATGSVIGRTFGGIVAYSDNSAAPGDVTVVAGGPVRGATGILSGTIGSGAVSVEARGAVTGTANDGIRVYSTKGDAGPVSVTAGSVTGGTDGIYAFAAGPGDLTVTSIGAVVGGSGRGMTVDRFAGTGGVDVRAGGPTAGSVGIFARGGGLGLIAVTAMGDVTGTAGAGIEVYAITATSTGQTLLDAAAAVAGAAGGIVVESYGLGDVAISAGGQVTATAGSGVRALVGNAGSSATLAVAVTDVASPADGVRASHAGAGPIAVITTGRVAAAGGDGISASAAGGGDASVTIASGAVSGGRDGIRVAGSGGRAAVEVALGARLAGGTGAAVSEAPAAVGPPRATVVTVSGEVDGAASGEAMRLGAGEDVVELRAGHSVAGLVDGGARARTCCASAATRSG